MLVVHPVSEIVATVKSSQINIISIFGRARQGKSFLMNCLSGERELFTVSNKKDSCTQGIDISSKWLSLKSFSSIDNDHMISAPVGGPEVHVGFCDAEGQGDKDVEYDAELVCPILLISKIVIFNWKGDLQKDHLLQTLGIMSQAAKNVGEEASSGAGARTPFGHLHIVFRDWQAVDTTAEEVLSDLLRPEGTTAGRARDLIRAELKKCFASIKAWLFDAPAQTELLKTRLTLDLCTPKFRKQVRELRLALSQQLRTGTTFSSSARATLTGRDLVPLVNQVTASINTGSPVLPQSAFLNMLKDDASKFLRRTVAALQQNGSEIYADVSKKAAELVRAGKDFAAERAAGLEASAIPTFSDSKSFMRAIAKLGLHEYPARGGACWTQYERSLLPTREQALSAVEQFAVSQLQSLAGFLSDKFGVAVDEHGVVGASFSTDPHAKLVKEIMRDAKAAAASAEALLASQLTTIFEAFFSQATLNVTKALRDKHADLDGSLGSKNSKLSTLIDAAARKHAANPEDALATAWSASASVSLAYFSICLIYPTMKQTSFPSEVARWNQAVDQVVAEQQSLSATTKMRVQDSFEAAKKKLQASITVAQKAALVDTAISQMRRACDETFARLVATNSSVVASAGGGLKAAGGARGKPAAAAASVTLCRGFALKDLLLLLDGQYELKHRGMRTTVEGLGADSATVEGVAKTFRIACEELSQEVRQKYNTLMLDNTMLAVTTQTKLLEARLPMVLPNVCTEFSGLQAYLRKVDATLVELSQAFQGDALESICGWTLGEEERRTVVEGIAALCDETSEKLRQGAERECEETQKFLDEARRAQVKREQAAAERLAAEKEVAEARAAAAEAKAAAAEAKAVAAAEAKAAKKKGAVAPKAGGNPHHAYGMKEDWDSCISPEEQKARARAFMDGLKGKGAGGGAAGAGVGVGAGGGKSRRIATPELIDDDDEDDGGGGMDVDGKTLGKRRRRSGDGGAGAAAPSSKKAAVAAAAAAAALAAEKAQRKRQVEEEKAKARAWADKNLPKKPSKK